ncbi:unnamed protein product [Cuscuta europaea]|uniref:Uncharacterized protein n=1 Tax=Cuscuta europaea TaxID=41803 RepID=A0A9P0ZAN6_CUSEU|nr:unnamed protein product [Cuscuta europaea]
MKRSRLRLPNRPNTTKSRRIRVWYSKEEILFKYDEFAVTRAEMLSLHENQHISAYVLDAWSTMLNARENLRSSHSLCRMFARAYDCVHSWVGELTPKKDRPVILNDAVEFALAGFPDNISIEHVELVKGLKKAKAKKVVMNWRHENNEYECNVLTMRLVDIYMGQGSKGWDIGIKNGDKKHMAAILSAECNEMKKTMWKRLRSMQK